MDQYVFKDFLGFYIRQDDLIDVFVLYSTSLPFHTWCSFIVHHPEAT